jgi:hypothetical protein
MSAPLTWRIPTTPYKQTYEAGYSSLILSYEIPSILSMEIPQGEDEASMISRNIQMRKQGRNLFSFSRFSYRYRENPSRTQRFCFGTTFRSREMAMFVKPFRPLFYHPCSVPGQYVQLRYSHGSSESRDLAGKQENSRVTRRLRCPTTAEQRVKQEVLILAGFAYVDEISFRFCTKVHACIQDVHNARWFMQYVCDDIVTRFSLLQPQVITSPEGLTTVTGLLTVMGTVHAQHAFTTAPTVDDVLACGSFGYL